MKFALFLGCISLLFHSGSAQNVDEISWKLVDSICCDSNAVWTVDWLGNLLIQKNGSINKIDTTGKVLFAQSIKKLGNVKTIMPVNAMKIAVFTEEQQSVCVFDNTLTLSQDCIDLARYDIQWATCFSPSGQQEKMWVFDELNNRLILISTNNTSQFQEIKNVTGILNCSKISEIEEFENRLFVKEEQGRLFEFDIYGSLANVFDVDSTIDFEFRNGIIVFLDANKSELLLINSNDMGKVCIDLPVSDVHKFKISGSYFFLQTVDKILKYEVSFLK